MDPIAIVEKLFGVAKEIKEHLDKVEDNKEQCILLVRFVSCIFD